MEKEERKNKCKLHTQNEYMYICEEKLCETQLVCSKCITIGLHKAHQVSEIKDFIQKQIAIICSETMKNKEKYIQRDFHFSYRQNITKLGEIEKQIQKEFDDILIKITKYLTNLMNQCLNQVTKSKIKMNKIYNMERERQISLHKNYSDSIVYIKTLLSNMKDEKYSASFEQIINKLNKVKNNLSVDVKNIWSESPQKSIFEELIRKEINIDRNAFLLKNYNHIQEIITNMTATYQKKSIKLEEGKLEILNKSQEGESKSEITKLVGVNQKVTKEKKSEGMGKNEIKIASVDTKETFKILPNELNKFQLLKPKTETEIPQEEYFAAKYYESDEIIFFTKDLKRIKEYHGKHFSTPSEFKQIKRNQILNCVNQGFEIIDIKKNKRISLIETPSSPISICVIPEKHKLALGMKNGGIYIYDENYEMCNKLEIGEEIIHKIIWIKVTKALWIGDKEGIIIWDIENNRKVRQYKQLGEIYALESTQERVFGGGETGILYEFGLQGTSITKIIKEIKSIKILHLCEDGTAVLGLDMGFISIWDLKNRSKINSLRCGEDDILQYSLCPVGGDVYMVGTWDNSIRLVNLGKKKILKEYPSQYQILAMGKLII